jgi:sugar phosphate isomerase/epimerase
MSNDLASVNFIDRRTGPTPMSVKLDAMAEDVSDMKASMKKLAEGLNRLTLLEERVKHSDTAVERAFANAEKLQARVAVLEQAQVTSKQTSEWVGKAMWAAAAAAAVFVAKKAGLV